MFGKTLSGSIIATIQGIIVLAFYPLVGLRLSFVQIILTIAAMFLIAVSITSLGILIASRMTSFEGFGTINNFMVMPLFFLSGAKIKIKKQILNKYYYHSDFHILAIFKSNHKIQIKE